MKDKKLFLVLPSHNCSNSIVCSFLISWSAMYCFTVVTFTYSRLVASSIDS